MVPDLIYDVGMNDGRDTAYYLAAGFRVVAIEANPRFTTAAQTRFASEINCGRLTILNVGMAEKSTTAEFWINDVNPDWSSFDRTWTARTGDPVHALVIQCRRLDDILAEHGVPYYLKIDIEKYDTVCCDQIPATDRPKFVSVEMSDPDQIAKLQNLGYDRFKLIRQFDFYPLQMSDAKPPRFGVYGMRALYRMANYRKENRSLLLRLGRAVAARIFSAAKSLRFSPDLWEHGVELKSRLVPGWTFRTGTSGGFGEDTPGEWLTAEQVRQIWQTQSDSWRRSHFELWCDLHAMIAD
jgi:FkbM family methyltransferase